MRVHVVQGDKGIKVWVLRCGGSSVVPRLGIRQCCVFLYNSIDCPTVSASSYVEHA